MAGSQSLKKRLDRFFRLTPGEALYFALVLALVAAAAIRALRSHDPLLLVTAAVLVGGMVVVRSAGRPSRAVLGSEDKESVPVELSAFAPRRVQPGGSFILSIWAYRPEDRALARSRAASGGNVEIGEKPGVEFPQRGTITVRLRLPSFEIDEEEDGFYWSGTPASASFQVKVPQGLSPGKYPGSARILVDGIPFAKILLEVVVGESPVAELRQAMIKRELVERVFASYSVKDMYEVLGRLQGLRALNPKVDIFLDVYSLRQGEEFKQRILDEVMSRDTFLLFWSRNAAASAWVDLEWRTALKRESGEFIPVPLEPAAKAPPPAEIANLNFNDSYAYHADLLRELEQLQDRLAQQMPTDERCAGPRSGAASGAC